MGKIDLLGVKEMRQKQFTSEEARFLYLKMVKKGMPPKQAYEETGKLIETIERNHLKAKEQARQEKLSFKDAYHKFKSKSSYKVSRSGIEGLGRQG